MLTKRFSNHGDTIVEVMVAIVVLGVVLVGAYATASQNLRSSRQTEERVEALKVVEGQIEKLRAASTGTGIFTQTAVFCMDSNATVQPATSPTYNVSPPGLPSANSDDFSKYVSCGTAQTGAAGITYYIAIERVETPAASGKFVFTVHVRWDSLVKSGRDEVALNYAIPQLTPLLPPPTVTLVANPTTVTKGQSVTLNATATDNASSTITKVDFYDGATLLGTDTTSPYSFTWNTTTSTSTGSHSITAVATDALSLTGTSSPVTVTVNAASYFATITGDGPVGFWRLGETSGTTAANSVSGNSGTYTNVTLGSNSLLVNDTANKAASFNGTSSRVLISNYAAIAPTNTVSIEAWIKPTTIPATFGSVATKAESYTLQFNSNRIEFTIMNAGTRYRCQSAVGAISAGNTYYIAGTYDGATQRLYINGTQVNSCAHTGSITTNINSLSIGSWDGTKEYFNGIIDEVAVYNFALTAAQIANHYSVGNTP